MGTAHFLREGFAALRALARRKKRTSIYSRRCGGANSVRRVEYDREEIPYIWKLEGNGKIIPIYGKIRYINGYKKSFIAPIKKLNFTKTVKMCKIRTKKAAETVRFVQSRKMSTAGLYNMLLSEKEEL